MEHSGYAETISNIINTLHTHEHSTVIVTTILVLACLVLCATIIFAVLLYKKNTTASHYRRVYRSCPLAHINYNSFTQKTECSHNLLEMFFIHSLPRTFHSFTEMLYDNNKKLLYETYQKLLSGTTQKEEFILITKSTSREVSKTIECTAKSFRDAYGQINSITFWFTDITHLTKEHSQLIAEVDHMEKSLEFFNALYEKAPFPIWQRDEKLTITHCNTTYRHIIDYHTEDSTTISELGNDTEALAKQVKKSQTLHREEQHIVVDGQRRLYAITEIPIAKHGHEYYHIGFGRDITELEDARNQIKRYISAQDDLLESSGCASAIFTPDTRLKYYNNAFVALWSLDQEWLDKEPTYGEFIETLREQRKIPEQPNFPSFKQEQLSWFTNLIEPHDDFIHLPNGTALRMIIIPHALGGLLISYEDITDKLEFERSYNTLIAVQRATLDHLHEGVCVLGQDGHLTLSNPTYAKLWNLSESYLETNPHISDIMDKTKDFYHTESNWQTFKDSMISQCFKRTSSMHHVERTDGSVIDVMNVPLPDGATLMAYLDITDSTLVERSLRERNEALEEADNLKTEFLANVSYELRSPLTSILGFSDALKLERFGVLNERQQEYIDSIYNSSQHLMTLINDTLDLSFIDAGFMEIQTDYISVYKTIMSIPPLIHERLKEKQLTLDVQCPANIGKILADEQRIRQLLFKLLSNAIKFTHKKGHIVLGAKRAQKGQVSIWVQDNGIGISTEEQQYVFQKFYRTEEAEKYHKAGAGLGLSLVKSFVELHEGEITLESEPDKGTLVTITLPRETELLIKAKRNKNNESRNPNIIYNA